MNREILLIFLTLIILSFFASFIMQDAFKKMDKTGGLKAVVERIWEGDRSGSK